MTVLSWSASDFDEFIDSINSVIESPAGQLALKTEYRTREELLYHFLVPRPENPNGEWSTPRFKALTSSQLSKLKARLSVLADKIYGSSSSMSASGFKLPSWWPYAAGGAGLLIVVFLMTRRH